MAASKQELGLEHIAYLAPWLDEPVKSSSAPRCPPSTQPRLGRCLMTVSRAPSDPRLTRSCQEARLRALGITGFTCRVPPSQPLLIMAGSYQALEEAFVATVDLAEVGVQLHAARSLPARLCVYLTWSPLAPAALPGSAAGAGGSPARGPAQPVSWQVLHGRRPCLQPAVPGAHARHGAGGGDRWAPATVGCGAKRARCCCFGLATAGPPACACAPGAGAPP